MSRQESPTGNAYGGLPPQDWRQSRNEKAFPASGWKRGFKGVCA
ncbi:hypothetical protein [Nostoc sp.]